MTSGLASRIARAGVVAFVLTAITLAAPVPVRAASKCAQHRCCKPHRVDGTAIGRAPCCPTANHAPVDAPTAPPAAPTTTDTSAPADAVTVVALSPKAPPAPRTVVPAPLRPRPPPLPAYVLHRALLV